MARKKQPVKAPPTTFDLWLYHQGAGWWLENRGYESAAEAAKALAGHVGKGNTIAGAVVPEGEPLGLFTQQRP